MTIVYKAIDGIAKQLTYICNFQTGKFSSYMKIASYTNIWNWRSSTWHKLQAGLLTSLVLQDIEKKKKFVAT